MWWMIHVLILVFAIPTVVSSDDGIILPCRNQTKESRIIGGSAVSIIYYVELLIRPLQYIHLTIIKRFSTYLYKYRHLTIDIPTLYQYSTMDNLPVAELSLQRTQFSQPHIVSRVKIILMISLYLSVVIMSMMVI